MQNTVNMLLTSMASKDKLAIISNSLEGNEELEAILTLANYHNVSSSALLKYQTKFDIVKGAKAWRKDSIKVYNYIVNGIGTDNMLISQKAFDVAALMFSPVASGVTQAQVVRALNTSSMSMETSSKVLDVGWASRVATNKECGVCGRSMVSVREDGLCSACRNELKDFTAFRRGAFIVPINSFNFTKLVKLSDTVVTFSFLDYKAVKVGDNIHYSHEKSQTDLGKTVLPLPIEEFARQIAVL